MRVRDVQDGRLVVRAGKTGKRASFEVTKGLADVLAGLRACNRRRDGTPIVSEYLVANSRGRRYTPDGFSSIWQRTMVDFAAAGGTRFGAKDIRAAHAATLDDLGGDATRNLQHSSRQVTTRHYLRRPQNLAVLDRAK